MKKLREFCGLCIDYYPVFITVVIALAFSFQFVFDSFHRAQETVAEKCARDMRLSTGRLLTADEVKFCYTQEHRE
jgi:hypothetical protein